MNWFRRLIGLRKEADEIAHWAWELVDPGDDRIIVMRYEAGNRCLLAAHNLCSTPAKAEIPSIPASHPGVELFADSRYERLDPHHPRLELKPYGYRWIRFLRN